MELYRRCWLTGAGFVAALGVMLAIIGLPGAAMLSIAVFSGLLWPAFRLSRSDDPDRTPATIRMSVISTLLGAAIGTSVAGWINEIHGYGLLFVLLVVATAPTSVERCSRFLTPAADASPVASPPPLEMLPAHVPRFPWEGSVPNLHGLTNDQVVFIWQSSYTALRRCRSATELVRIGDTRRLCLDELEHRDPEGFARWVGAGARAASDPRRYLDKQDVELPDKLPPTARIPNQSATLGLPTKEGRIPVQIDKNQIIELLTSRGDHDKATQADQELPGTVDTNKDAGLLSKFGIDPKDLLGKLPGGVADKLPGGLGDKLGF